MPGGAGGRHKWSWPVSATILDFPDTFGFICFFVSRQTVLLVQHQCARYSLARSPSMNKGKGDFTECMLFIAHGKLESTVVVVP